MSTIHSSSDQAEIPSVRLVALTRPIDETVTTDGFVAYAARVSNPANQNNHESAPRLLRYLREHQHWSPFEMAHAVIEIVTMRDIARQMLRHRSFAFQEFSQRYSDKIEFAAPREARRQDPKNRQNSLSDPDDFTSADWRLDQNAVMEMAGEAYAQAIQNGIAKEVARAVLPEGLTVSRLYMAGSLRSWLHYVELRSGPETQKEHREIAEMCGATLAEALPAIFGGAA